MNRKEFTNLLLEWRKNFINERTFRNFNTERLGVVVTDKHAEMLESINFPINLISVPLPIHATFGRTSPGKHEALSTVVGVYKKNLTNYNKVRDLLIDGIRTGEKEEIQLDFRFKNVPREIDKKSLSNIKAMPSAEDIEAATSEEAVDNLIEFFENNEDLLKDNFPLFIFQTNLSAGSVDADGGTFRLNELPEQLAESFLKWTFSHDFFHELEGFYEKTYKEILGFNNHGHFEDSELSTVAVPGLEMTAGSGDNQASVLPFIVFKDDSEIEEFIRENHLTHQSFKDKLKVRGIEYTSGYDFIKKISEMTDVEFLDFVKKQVKIAKICAKNFRRDLEKLFNSLENSIIFLATN